MSCVTISQGLGHHTHTSPQTDDAYVCLWVQNLQALVCMSDSNLKCRKRSMVSAPDMKIRTDAGTRSGVRQDLYLELEEGKGKGIVLLFFRPNVSLQTDSGLLHCQKNQQRCRKYLKMSDRE